MYELHKTWCADTLLSNSVICAIEVLQHDKQKYWSPKCISSAEGSDTVQLCVRDFNFTGDF